MCESRCLRNSVRLQGDVMTDLERVLANLDQIDRWV